MKCVVPFLLLVSIAANANTFPFAAVVEDDSGPVDGLVSLELRVVDGADVVWTETQPAVIVVDGVLAVDVGTATPLPNDVPTQAALVLVIEGDELPPLPLARLYAAQTAVRAQRAGSASQATSLNGSTAADVATRTPLGAAGGPPVAFANISGVPAAVADGDQGTDVISTSADFAGVGGRTLSIASVDGARLANAAVNGSRLAAGSVGTTHVADGTITTADIADGTMTAARLAADVTKGNAKLITVYRLPAICDDELSLLPTCSPPECGFNLRRACDDSACNLPLNGTCPGTAVGNLVVDQ